MDHARILLKLVFDKIGLDEVKLDTFANRLRIQKKIYLVQIVGLDLGYKYNWYIKGPYCPSLTENAFLLRQELDNKDNDINDYNLSKVALEYISHAKQLMNKPDDVELDEPAWLELLASLHYLKAVAYWPSRPSKEDVVGKLQQAKPHFTGKTKAIDQAWCMLENFNLIEQKECGSDS